MTMEHMGCVVEVWPVAADAAGLWLLTPEAWESGRVAADDEPHSEVNFLLAEHAVDTVTRFVHSTSWRVDGPAVVLTYVAAVAIGDALDVKDRFPNALPIGGFLLESAGQAEPGPATSAPAPRHLDVLMHAVRHLAFLLDYDDTAGRVLDGLGFAGHLRALGPALAGMYREPALDGVRWPEG